MQEQARDTRFLRELDYVNTCPCSDRPHMHDTDRVCVLWERHAGLPCGAEHSTLADAIKGDE